MLKEMIEQKVKKEISRRKWSCWYAASFARSTAWYREAVNYPGRYKEGAETDFAQMALADLLELHELDKDGCRMVVDSWHNEINQMIETLHYEQKYYKVFA